MVARGNGLGSVRSCGGAIEGAGTYQDCANFFIAWRNRALRARGCSVLAMESAKQSRLLLDGCHRGARVGP